MADKNTVFHQKLSLNVQGRLIDLSQPKIMGILNLTPDSFYDGGQNNDPVRALKAAEEMLSHGAHFLDIGAYSSRPGAEHIDEKEEYDRLIPVIKKLVREFPDAILSIDTFRSGIAKAAVIEGAHMINDISAGEMDAEMFTTIASLKVPYILMHMRGTPQTMVSKTHYDDIMPEILQYFANKIETLRGLGLKDLVIDPGFGFSKTPDQSYEVLRHLELLKTTGHPILAGLSRKSMIYKLLDTDSANALNGTIVANTIALMKGANILRVHDVKAAAEAIKIVGKVI